MVSENSEGNEVSVIFGTDDSVSEVYKEHGKRIVESLEGEYSFALYDQKNDIYFAARDPLGVKALYYTKTANGYRFSDDISELLTLPTVEKKPALGSMRTMLECQAVDHHATMYEGIRRLPPGHTLTIKQGEVSIERYWHPEKIEINNAIGEKEAAGELRKLIEKAVDRQIGDLDATAFELSGGLDSSSVVALLAHRVLPSSISSYSMEFSGLDCNESEYVDAMLERYSLSHRKIPTGNLDYAEKYSLEYLYTLSPDWPITITFAMSLPMIERMVADGKRVIVTGQGGDHLFTGTPHVMNTLLRRGRLAALARELRNYRHPVRVFRDYALRPFFSRRSVERIKKILGKKPADPFGYADCTPFDADVTVGISDPARKFDLDTLTSALHTTLMDGNLFHCAEKHFGVEYRHPFFDRELVEFALSLPPEMKYRNRTIKWILREAMEGILPEKIRQRRDKAEFSEVLMRQIDALDLDELLGDPCIVRLGLIEKKRLEHYRESYRKREKRYTVPFWAAINVEYWYRYHGFDCR